MIGRKTKEDANNIIRNLKKSLDGLHKPDGEKTSSISEVTDASFIILQDLFSLEELNDFVTAAFKATDVPSAIISPAGDTLTKLPDDSICAARQFCAICRNSKNQTDFSCYSVLHGDNGLGTDQKPTILICDAGFLCGHINITIGDKLLATWAIGQVQNADDLIKKDAFLKKGIINTDDILKTIPKITVQKFIQTCEALHVLGTQISKQSYQKVRYKQSIERSREAEFAIRENEKRYRILFESANEAILILTANDNTFLTCNKRALDMFGVTHEDIINKTPLDFSPKYQPNGQLSKTFGKEKYRAALMGTPQFFEWEHKRNDGTRFYAEVSLTEFTLRTGTYFQTLIRDVTSRIVTAKKSKRLQERINTNEKMKALGTLAGGIAHNFNNLLMAIQANASLVLREVSEDSKAFTRLKYIEQYTDDGAKMTEQILGYARDGKYEVEPTNINQILDKANEMLKVTIRDLGIDVEYEKDIWKINVDRGQIEQVVLNVYVNAWQAMPEGGSIYVRTRNIKIDKQTETLISHLEPGDYIELMISDTGHGMNKETMKRIFDPFFTTRDTGQGTGMGLASAHGIIKSHSGYIHVESKINKGTKFYIYLPATRSERAIEQPFSKEPIPLSGHETIMIVDDEYRIAEATETMLKTLGYKTLLAYDGQEAIDLFHKKQNDISCIILDVKMPGMSGKEAFKKIREVDPAAKIIVATGYGIDDWDLNDTGKYDGFLKKPFKLYDVSKALRDVIDNPPM